MTDNRPRDFVSFSRGSTFRETDSLPGIVFELLSLRTTESLPDPDLFSACPFD